MKLKRIIFCTSLIMAIAVISCKDELVNKAVVKSNPAANDLLAPSAATFVLTQPNAAANFETFKWTAADFGFTGSVTYKLQVDKGTGTWSVPIELASTVSPKLEAGITVGNMNGKLLGLGLTPGQAAQVKLRVVSTVNNKVDNIISSEKTITVTPYATIFPSLWGMGDGLNGWGPWNDKEVEWPTTDGITYFTYAQLTNNGAFRFFVQHDWNPSSYNYNYFSGGVSPILISDGGSDANFKMTGTTGWYLVSFNMNNKTVTVSTSTEPTLFATGAAINGWGWAVGQYVKLKFIKPGVFETTTAFTTQNETFRFFAQADWSPTGYNYPYFTGGVNAIFVNAADGDSNFRYVVAPASQKLRVDLVAKTVVKLP